MLNRRLLRNFDFFLLVLTIIIPLYGLLILRSATFSMELGTPLFFVTRQALWIGAGLVAIIVLAVINYINFANWSRYFYIFSVGLLALVPFIGIARGGAYRWLSLGAFDLQPSEVAKLVIIISLARLLAEQSDFERFTDLLPAFLHIALPMFLIFMQPDLGTSLIFVVILFGMLFIAGAQWRHLAAIIFAGLAIIPILFPRLEEYQRMRLLVFVNPGLDPLGHGFQLLQSKIAVGSGGVFGRGFLEGSQVQRQFLPAQHTDFIFSVLGEEFGLLGGLLLLILFVLMIYRILRIASVAKDRFGFLLCCGVATMLAFQVTVNIGMTIGVMPVTGMPLPFMSYGGSAMLVNMASIGLVLNVGMRRHKIQF